MNTEEIMLMVELLLRDIRGNWGWENEGNRATKAKELAESLAGKVYGMEMLSIQIGKYMDSSDKDGRFFRNEFPYGYEYMKAVHGLDSTIKDKSEDFIKTAKEYITYPNVVFEDWSEE